MKQNGSGNTKVACKKKKRAKRFKTLNSQIEGERLTLTLPLLTVSEANTFEHWSKKHKRHKAQKDLVAFVLKPLLSYLKLPCHIKLTRFAPRKLDMHDNLPMSLKYIVDACCSIVTGNSASGQADSDDRISIEYDQNTCPEYGVGIEFTFNPTD
jgi:hypothetical protein